jgi:hypothetical protein
VLAHDPPPGVAKDVTDKENTQKASSFCFRWANDPATGTK